MGNGVIAEIRGYVGHADSVLLGGLGWHTTGPERPVWRVPRLHEFSCACQMQFRLIEVQQLRRIHDSIALPQRIREPSGQHLVVLPITGGHPQAKQLTEGRAMRRRASQYLGEGERDLLLAPQLKQCRATPALQVGFLRRQLQRQLVRG
jgi:hypothetical protein